MRHALSIEYSGDGYSGWQQQAGVMSIQEVLQNAISKVANAPISVVCAGRTDRGVHACAQIVHFDTTSDREPSAWVRGVNQYLPKTVRVLAHFSVSEDFHARFSASSRLYRYVFYHREVSSAILDKQVRYCRFKLNLDRMNQALAWLVGEHDFSAFRASGCQAKSPVRTVSCAKAYRCGEFSVVEIQANAFLYHMVRNIIGTLLPIAKGEKDPLFLKEILEGKNRQLAPATAPYDGLYLVGIEYPEVFSIPFNQQGPVFLADG